MQDVSVALSEVKDLYHKVLGTAAPVIGPHAYVPFPAGVDPIAFAIEEVRNVSKLADEMAGRFAPVAWIPRADAFVERDGLVIHVEIPGVAREDVKVFSTGGEIVVRGERKQPGNALECKPLALERLWGPFERRFALPPGMQLERVTARYANGILEVRVVGPAVAVPAEKPVEIV